MNKKNIFNDHVEKRYSAFTDLEKRINPDNLIYKYKNEEISPKNFRNLIELFKDLREVTINPNEVLKDQINFKSNLGEIKREIKS